MGTRYIFEGAVYYTFADLLNAYKAAKGYFPTLPYSQDGCTLYYR